MELERLVPTRETCERMKAAGFPQEAAFWWYYIGGPDEYAVSSESDMAECKRRMDEAASHDSRGLTPTIHPERQSAAPTFAEIAERLPLWASFNRVADDKWNAYIAADKDESEGVTCAEAAALLWLALNEKGTPDGK